MLKTSEWKQALESGKLDSTIRNLIVISEDSLVPEVFKQRFLDVLQNFVDIFADSTDPEVAFFFCSRTNRINRESYRSSAWSGISGCSKYGCLGFCRAK